MNELVYLVRGLLTEESDCIIGVFDDENLALDAYRNANKTHGFCYDVVVTCVVLNDTHKESDFISY